MYRILLIFIQGRWCYSIALISLFAKPCLEKYSFDLAAKWPGFGSINKGFILYLYYSYPIHCNPISSTHPLLL
jgi:hypothetical protein